MLSCLRLICLTCMSVGARIPDGFRRRNWRQEADWNEMKRKPVSQTKWGKLAVRLARMKNGQSFRIDSARYGRKKDVFRFAREIRNGLNGHNRILLIRRTVAVVGRFIAIKRVGDW
jgi:hypothetical protein